MSIPFPSFDYEQPDIAYAGHRRADPSIAAYVQAALGDARSVINVGAGAGSYEPEDRYVVAVEPSATMRRQRPGQGRVPALIGTAAHLPFDDGAFDAAMAMVTVHHWPDIVQGLRELRRVAARRVLVLTFDPEALHLFWNEHYFPEVVAAERRRYPKMSLITGALGGRCEVQEVPIPFDCTDGFQEAFYGRPEAFLNPDVRRAQSAWGFVPEAVNEGRIAAFAAELASGGWDRRFGAHRTMPYFTGALRLITAHL